MSRETFLAELESLSDAARIRRMVDEGRASIHDSSIQLLLEELSRGGFYERRLSLQSCFGSRDSQHVLRSLSDPSMMLRGLAIRMVAIVCDDDQALHAFSVVTTRSARKKLIRRLSKRRRFDVVDEYLRRMMAQQNKDVNELVSYASPAFVKEYLQAHGDQQAASIQWVRVARFHPEVAADALCRIAASKQQRDGSLRAMAWSGVLSELAERSPDRAMELAELWMKLLAPSEIQLQRLVECAPRAMAQLVLSRPEPFRVNFAAVADRLELSEIRQLLGQRGDNLLLEKRWFRRRTPAERLALREEFHRGWRDSSGCLPTWLIELLPSPQRANEARGHWKHSPLATRPLVRLPFAASLPWQEAKDVLDSFIRSPDAELRAPAIRSLVLSVRFSRSAVSDLLSFAQARRNEQDPVRLAMLSAMTELPPKVWRSEHLDSLGIVVRQALDSADISFGTASEVQKLIVRLLPFFPEWSTAWLATVVKERGNFGYVDLSLWLSHEDTRRIAPVLLPVLNSWSTRERQNELLSAASSFGRRLRVFPELVALLEGIARSTASVSNPGMVMYILKQYVPESFRQLVPRLIAADPSWMTQPAVYQYVHRRRQDLLTPFLGRIAYKGRFSTGNTRFVMPVASGFQRWTPAQQRTFRRTLEDVTNDAMRDSPALLQVIRQLAAMPDELSERLVQLADMTNTKLMTRDTALRMLGRMDGGQGVPILLSALDDDRGRIAIYALRQALLQMPQTLAIALLRGVSATKVTVAKEVVRLLGELRTEESFQELIAWNDRPLHRDVRIALLRAMWDHLDKGQAWEMLDAAARSEDAAVATMAGRTPAERLNSEAQQRLISVILTVLNHPDPKVRCDGLARCQTLPVTDPQNRLMPALTKAMMSPIVDEVEAAAAAVLSNCDGSQAAAIAHAVGELLENRRALTVAMTAIQARAVWNSVAMQPIIRQVLDSLKVAPLTITLRARLAASSLDAPDLLQFFDDHLNELHAEALMTAVDILSKRPMVAFALRGSDLSSGEPAIDPKIDDETLETRFGCHPDPRIRRLSLACLVSSSKGSRGWTESLREQLATLQQDPSSLVAEAANFTFPVEIPVV